MLLEKIGEHIIYFIEEIISPIVKKQLKKSNRNLDKFYNFQIATFSYFQKQQKITILKLDAIC